MIQMIKRGFWRTIDIIWVPTTLSKRFTLAGDRWNLRKRQNDSNPKRKKWKSWGKHHRFIILKICFYRFGGPWCRSGCCCLPAARFYLRTCGAVVPNFINEFFREIAVAIHKFKDLPSFATSGWRSDFKE